MMDINKIKKVHFVGIGGIGVSAIAKLMIHYNKVVSGSDICLSDTIDELKKIGVKIFKNHDVKNIHKDIDLVIYSSAIPNDNPEILKADSMSIPKLSYPEFLAELSREKFTIAVSGTNGKSTTVAILGMILEKAGVDPLVILGSKVPQWNGNIRFGNSDYFVVEACEYQANMLKINPDIIVLTNLEEDHLDFYKDIDHIVNTFQIYVNKLPKHGVLITNIDDENLNKLKTKKKTITYSTLKRADVMAKNIGILSDRQEFDVLDCHRRRFMHFLPKFINCNSYIAGLFSNLRASICMPGIFNIYNTLAATSTALSMKVKPDIIKQAINEFSGLWRRFEIVGEYNEAIIISDYAHHPTSVLGTINTINEFYKNKRIIVVFQPHHHNRTKKLFDEFVKSFDNADLLIISEIYNVAGREKKRDNDISSKDLVNAIQKQNNDKQVCYVKDLKQAKKLVLKNINKNDVVLIIGAGDVDIIARELVK